MTLTDALLVAALATPLGAIAVWLAGAFRTGRVRALAKAYWNPTSPFYLRNVAFMLGPGGVALFLMVGAGFLFASGGLVGAVAGLTLTCLMVAAFIIGVAWSRRPPEFLKPAWLMDEEAVRGRQPAGVGFARWIDVVVWVLALCISASIPLGIGYLIFRPT